MAVHSPWPVTNLTMYGTTPTCAIAFNISEGVRSYLTLNIAQEIITPRFLLLIRIIPKLFQPSCPPSATYTMLGTCYTCCGIVL